MQKCKLCLHAKHLIIETSEFFRVFFYSTELTSFHHEFPVSRVNKQVIIKLLFHFFVILLPVFNYTIHLHHSRVTIRIVSQQFINNN